MKVKVVAVEEKSFPQESNIATIHFAVVDVLVAPMEGKLPIASEVKSLAGLPARLLNLEHEGRAVVQVLLSGSRNAIINEHGRLFGMRSNPAGVELA